MINEQTHMCADFENLKARAFAMGLKLSVSERAFSLSPHHSLPKAFGYVDLHSISAVDGFLRGFAAARDVFDTKETEDVKD